MGDLGKTQIICYSEILLGTQCRPPTGWMNELLFSEMKTTEKNSHFDLHADMFSSVLQ